MRTLPMALLLLCGCSGELGAVRCDTDDNCVPGWYCSAAGQCAEAAACAGNAAATCAVVAPTGLSAVGERSQVSLAWNPVGGATSYAVRRATVHGGPYVDLASAAVAGLVDQGLSPATTYYYVVHAIGPGGAGADSSEASALTTPAAPAHLLATAATGQISLMWDPVPGVTGYQVTRAGNDGVYLSLAAAPATPTTYVDSGLASGATWSYEVLAVNGSGASAPSNAAGATTP